MRKKVKKTKTKKKKKKKNKKKKKKQDNAHITFISSGHDRNVCEVSKNLPATITGAAHTKYLCVYSLIVLDLEK